MRAAWVGLAVLGLLLGLAWYKRTAVMLAYVEYQTRQIQQSVGPPRQVAWQQGPDQAEFDQAGSPPNIILIVADDLGYNDISTFGGGLDDGLLQTPSIDRLAAEGVVFQQSYSGASTCAPSRAMMMTGRYPTRTGFEFTPTPDGMSRVVDTIVAQADSGLPPVFFDGQVAADAPPFSEQGLPSAEYTVAEALAEAGYYTAHIGKWHLGTENGMAPHEQGFEDSLLMMSALHLPETDPGVVNATLPFDPIDQFLWARGGWATSFNSGNLDLFEPGGYLADYWTDEAIHVIEANRNRPFFLYLAHWGPHTPLQATREDFEAVGDIRPHRKRVYAAMIRAIDRSVGRILAALAENGIDDNTLVLFTSDNGGAGYLGIPDVNAPYRGWKITMFEGGIRVPLIARWPAQIESGRQVSEPVAHIDIMPTLASIAGATLPVDREIDGVDLKPLMTGDATGPWQRERLFWQNGHYQVVREGNWKLQVNDRPTDGRQLWLYDLAADPTEKVNLADERPGRVARLMALLDAHQAGSVGPLYPSAIQVPIMVDKTLAERFVAGDEYVYTPN